MNIQCNHTSDIIIIDKVKFAIIIDLVISGDEKLNKKEKEKLKNNKT